MNWLKIICDEHNTSMYQISKITGISHQQLSKINNRYINDLKLNECGLIVEALGLTIPEFWEKYYERFKK